MKKQFYWLFLVGLLLVSVVGFAKQTTYPTMNENGKTYYLYTVQKSEGLYAISQRFSVPQALIIEANPGVEQGLKLGQQIKVPKVETNNQKKSAPIKVGKDQHIVKAKETLYSLSKKYNCTVDELLELNPWATHLTIGSVLQIPSKNTNNKDVATEIAPVEEAQNQTTETKESKTKKNIWSWFSKKETKATADTATTVTTTDTIASEAEDTILLPTQAASHVKLGILLPFMLDSVKRDASMDRFVEFYQGCLLAADSLANMGLTTEIYTFDIGTSTESLHQALNNPQLANVDLIIGPAYQNQVNDVATYAAKNKIPTIIPFASNVPGINNNPYLFEVVTPQKELYTRLIQKCSYLFQDKHVILIKPYMLAQYNKADFANLLTEAMHQTHIGYTTLSDQDLAINIDSIAAMYPEQECIIVMPSTHGVALNKLGEALHQIRQNNVAVFAFPEWNSLGINELYSKKMYQFSSYYTSFSNPNIIEFFQQLKDKFGLPTTVQQSPNFAIFGFDISYFFLQQYQNNGKYFIHYMPKTEVNGLQMNFLFDQVENGGYWNVGTIIKQINKDGISDL